MNTHSKSSWIYALALACLVGSCAWAFAHGNMDATDKYAWAENAGWHNYAPTHGGVTVYPDGANGYLTGYAWAESVGWIKFGVGTGPYANTAANNYGVNLDAAGNLSGYAWSENSGWINFNSTHSQVAINLTTGRFDGYAWSEFGGWIHFKNDSPAYNVRVILPAPDPDGTLAIEVTPATGAWRIVNPPAGYVGPRSGTGNLAPITAPAGTYNVAWDDLAGYVAPAPATGDLAAGGTLVFSGVWLEVTDELAPPKGVSATDGTYSNFVRVTWHGIESLTRSTVLGYEIWRNTVNDPSTAIRIADIPAVAAVADRGSGELPVRLAPRSPTAATEESDSGTSSFIIHNSYFSYDDYDVVQNVSYYYWVRAKTAVQISRMSYVGAGYASLNPDQMDGEADLAVSDLVFLPVNMRPDTSAGTVSLRLKNLGPDALNDAGVEFDFYMGTSGTSTSGTSTSGTSASGTMLWIGGAHGNFTLPAGAAELVILTPQARRGIAVRGDLPRSGILTTQVRVRHLTDLHDPNPVNNVTESAGRVRVLSSGVNSRGRGLTDYDGDGKSDVVLLDHDRTRFAFLLSGSLYTGVHYADTGVSSLGYQPALGDYDGDGLLDFGLYEESTGRIYAQLSSTDEIVSWAGLPGPGYRVVTGDYDGDGLCDPALYHEETGLWIGRFSSQDYAVRYTYAGGPGYLPVHGDFDGDGKIDPAAYSESAGRLITCLSSYNYQKFEQPIGGPGWTAVRGDFDGDGMADLAGYHEATGIWFAWQSNHGQGYIPVQGQLGGPGWIPIPGDFDGDGLCDPVVYNPTGVDGAGYWMGLLSSQNYAPAAGGFGGLGDAPVTE